MGSCRLLHLLPIYFFAVNAFLGTRGNLSPNYYSRKCPQALSISKAGVVAAIKNETCAGASLLRLHFHDCFVNGCDALILLDYTANFVGEKTAAPNKNSVGGFEVIDHSKAKLENACPAVVSCADILALAARDSVVYVRTPLAWLGARPIVQASLVTQTPLTLPSPSRCRDSAREVGTMTISRLLTSIDASFSKSLQRQCPRSGNDDNLAPLDLQTPNYSDNLYFKNLLKKKGPLQSDQALFNGSSADSLVRRYASNNFSFYKDFANAMVKMGNIRPLTERKGEIRIDCRKPN